MSIQTKTAQSIKNYSKSIDAAAAALRYADAILVGAGSGLSASGGLDYGDANRAREIFPVHYSFGLTSTMEILSAFWKLTPGNAAAFWAVWSRHIYETAYRTPALEPYLLLFKLLNRKTYFIISSNVDGQFVKAGFPEDKLFEPQGRYSLFQCSTPCRQEVFDNRKMLETMMSNMPSPLAIREEDVPYCPYCGNLLMPNLRFDEHFVETPHLRNKAAYLSFIEKYQKKKLVLLELGVGFNSPGVIRYPFEHMAHIFKNACLVRVNPAAAESESKDDAVIHIQDDCTAALENLHALTIS